MTYEEALVELAQEIPNLIILTAENRAAIRNIPAILGNRFIDFGIAEQTMAGAAAGLALRGRIPVAHALAAFLTMRAFEFIRTDTGIPGLPTKFVGSLAGFLSEANGPTHQAIEDISLMRAIPGMGIFCPADEEELVYGLPQILMNQNPYYIRFNAAKPLAKHSKELKLGHAETIGHGTDATILTYGFLLREAIAARALLQERGINIRVLNLHTLRPIDETKILKAAKETQRLFVLEDHFITGGLYSIVCEILVRKLIQRRVIPICLEDHWFRPGLLPDVLRYHGFTGEQISFRIQKEL